MLAFSPNTSVLAGSIRPTAPSGNVYGVPLDSAFTSGWMRLIFTGTNAVNVGVTGQNYRYYGLPVQGFGIKTYRNAAVGNEILRYGIAQEHAYTRYVVSHTWEPEED